MMQTNRIATGVQPLKETTAVVDPLTLTEAEIGFYDAQGFLLLPGFVRADTVEVLREEVLTVLEANGVSRASLNKASCAADRLRQCSQYLRDSALDRLINGPATRSVASQLLRGEARTYLPFTAVKAAGGGGRFDYHQDNNYTRHEPALGSLNIWVALVDMTPDNGCLRLIPASHQRGQLSSSQSEFFDGHRKLDIDERELLPIRMRAGDAVAFTRWTVHGSGANHSDQPRVAYALQYHRDDVRYFDSEFGTWELLSRKPRWNVDPVDRLGGLDG